MRFNKTNTTTKMEETSLPCEVEDTEKESAQTRSFHRPVKKQETKSIFSNTRQDKGETNKDKTYKILPKFVNRSPKAEFGSAVEFSSSAFGLSKLNANGYRDSMEGKMLMNFWTFDNQTNHQLNLIPTYIDMSEWLNVCHFITSERINKATAAARDRQAKGGYAYCSFIYQSNGGSYKPIFKVNGKAYGGNDNPVATIFKITPAKKDDSWVLSSEIYEGVTEATGLIAPKSGTKPVVKIQVLMTYSDLIRIARMSEMAIQAYMNQFATQYLM